VDEKYTRKPEGKRPVGRTKRRWKDNIEMWLEGVGRGDVKWIYVAQIRVKLWAIVNTVMYLRVP
jgi:hypothetical protein